MTREEYIKYTNVVEDWAPGWEAIDNCLKRLYHNQEPKHFASPMPQRAIFGGEHYLDGISIYQSSKGHKHIVTYGMSELYTNIEAFGGEFSKWGYEMTIKLPMCADSECMWAIDVLSSLAKYTFTQGRYFEPFECISGSGNPIKIGSGSKLTAFIATKDTELEEVNTIHGKLDFIQLVGITQRELEKLIKEPAFGRELVDNMTEDNPLLITDLSRTIEYV